ncbi:MAG: TetR/AcrR family transcriptional regulator [Pseudomonadales bacterium]
MTEQRLARRAAILEAARQMIAERGYEAVTVRDLAEICRVSVPTLYNQFGGKDQLLAAAIEEHFLFALDGALIQQTAPGFERLLIIIDQCADQLLNVPRYHQRLLEAFASLTSTLQIQERIAQGLSSAIATELETMAGKRQVLPWTSPVQLAGQMTTACIGTAIQWSAGVIADELLKAQMRYALGLVVFGVARGAARTRLESQIQTAQEQIDAAPILKPVAQRGKNGAS